MILSWNDGLKIRHLDIEAKEEQYNLQHQNSTFPTISALVDYYRNFSSRRNLYLLQGLTNNNVTDDILYMRMTKTLKNEPYSLPYYHGFVSHKVVKDMI